MCGSRNGSIGFCGRWIVSTVIFRAGTVSVRLQHERDDVCHPSAAGQGWLGSIKPQRSVPALNLHNIPSFNSDFTSSFQFISAM